MLSSRKFTSAVKIQPTHVFMVNKGKTEVVLFPLLSTILFSSCQLLEFVKKQSLNLFTYHIGLANIANYLKTRLN